MNDSSKAEVGAFLRQGAWFGALPKDLQHRILGRATVHSFAKGQMFQVEDAEPIGLAAILEGRVLLLRHVDNATPTLVHVGGPGFWFGEGAVLDGVTLVTAVAQSATRLLILSKPEFDRIVTDEPRYYPAFVAIVLARYRVLLQFYVEAHGLSADDRLRLRLADLAEMRRLDGTVEGQAVTLDHSQAELATLVGMSRQKLNARLRVLQDDGLVTASARRITVLDPATLRASVLGTDDA